MTNEENEIFRLRRAIERELSQGPSLLGCLRFDRRSCRKPGCRCKSGRREDLHGPYARHVIYMTDGKYLVKHVPKRFIPRFQEAVARRKRIKNFEKAISVLKRLSILGRSLEDCVGLTEYEFVKAMLQKAES